MVDSDNDKSKREYRKRSKFMGDRLDKEKGRSVQLIPFLNPALTVKLTGLSGAADSKHNHSSEMIW